MAHCFDHAPYHEDDVMVAGVCGDSVVPRFPGSQHLHQHTHGAPDVRREVRHLLLANLNRGGIVNSITNDIMQAVLSTWLTERKSAHNNVHAS